MGDFWGFTESMEEISQRRNLTTVRFRLLFTVRICTYVTPLDDNFSMDKETITIRGEILSNISEKLSIIMSKLYKTHPELINDKHANEQIEEEMGKFAEKIVADLHKTFFKCGRTKYASMHRPDKLFITTIENNTLWAWSVEEIDPQSKQ
ncbi:hypothetical protein DdX_13910 [Ditylenchus destructor]|uniref:Uncharacterized protein n=1 Tax=Ditylenchus destructor TaxID=166010 RepID=A0AAD4MT45_9BILA|nr:hypothetical protein DdX_13910 [Ditylenchus destructor]